MTAVPAATAVTVPRSETVATFGLLDRYTTALLESSAPLALETTAVRSEVCPASSSRLDGVTTTRAATSAATVTGAVPRIPSTVATMLVVPGDLATT